MRSDAQAAVQNEQKLEAAKAKFRERMLEFVNLDRADVTNCRQAFLTAHAAATDFFNLGERTVGDSSLLGAHDDPLWLRYKVETCEAILDNVLDFHVTAAEMCPSLDLPRPEPSPGAYAGMQRLLKREQPDKAAEMRNRFLAAGLPTRGFDEDLPPRPSRNEATVKFTKDGMEATGLPPDEAARVASSYANATIDNAQAFGGIAQNAPQTIEALPSTSKRGGYLSLVIKGALAIGATVAAAYALAALGSRGCAPEAVFPSPTSASSSVAPPAAASSQ